MFGTDDINSMHTQILIPNTETGYILGSLLVKSNYGQ